MNKKLTPEQAIEQGYTHCTIDQTDVWFTITSLIEDGRPEYYQDRKIMLLDKNKTPFHISADTIRECLNNHIEEQEDYYCEDDTIYDELCQTDWEAIEKLVNAGFKPRFMFPTEIELIINQEA